MLFSSDNVCVCVAGTELWLSCCVGIREKKQKSKLG